MIDLIIGLIVGIGGSIFILASSFLLISTGKVIEDHPKGVSRGGPDWSKPQQATKIFAAAIIIMFVLGLLVLIWAPSTLFLILGVVIIISSMLTAFTCLLMTLAILSALDAKPAGVL